LFDSIEKAYSDLIKRNNRKAKAQARKTTEINYNELEIERQANEGQDDAGPVSS